MTDFIEKNPNLEGSSSIPLVAILLCTYNGARFLAEQLDSLESQAHQNWVVIASDDGSTDQTLEILRQYQAKWPSGKLTIRSGPQKGFCQNFLSLACDPNIRADYYAFCDQDDVWLPEKLTVALENVATNQQTDVPYLYCGRTKYVNEKLKPCGMSPLFVFPPSFRNALVQSIAGGNTMVFNQTAKSLLEKVGPVDVPSHDWWAYLLVTSRGGNVYYEKNSYILYRQHPKSLVGQNKTLFSQLRRLIKLLRGRFKVWNSKNITSLEKTKAYMSEASREIFSLYRLMREANLKDRLRLMQVCGVYRQTKSQTALLFLVIIFKKL